MTRILIIGANGQLARHATRALLETSDAELTLFLRRSARLANPDPSRARIVEGDAADAQALRAAMAGQDVVYANLAGDMPRAARAIIAAMRAEGLRRLIFISSMGIYGEVAGEAYRPILDPYRDSAALVEASALDYTIVRPGWFTRARGQGYRLTHKGEPFLGHDVSLDALSTLIAALATTPDLHVGESLGVSAA